MACRVWVALAPLAWLTLLRRRAQGAPAGWREPTETLGELDMNDWLIVAVVVVGAFAYSIAAAACMSWTVTPPRPTNHPAMRMRRGEYRDTCPHCRTATDQVRLTIRRHGIDKQGSLCLACGKIAATVGPPFWVKP